MYAFLICLSVLYLTLAGDGSPTAANEPSTASQLCEAEKQQRAQKCNQRNATPIPGSRASLTVRISLENRRRSV